MSSTSLAARYNALVQSGAIERDPAQLDLVKRLDHLAAELSEHRLARKSSALGWLFGKKQPEPIRGLYVWGQVGRGKTMLMDLFFEGLGVRRKRRVHFHEFMADVHERIHAWRQKLKQGLVRGDDPIRPVAEALADEAWVLCFDEFAVTDIADAMILGCSSPRSSSEASWSSPPPTWSRTGSMKAASTGPCSCPSSPCSRSA